MSDSFFDTWEVRGPFPQDDAYAAHLAAKLVGRKMEGAPASGTFDVSHKGKYAVPPGWKGPDLVLMVSLYRD